MRGKFIALKIATDINLLYTSNHITFIIFFIFINIFSFPHFNFINIFNVIGDFFLVSRNIHFVPISSNILHKINWNFSEHTRDKSFAWVLLVPWTTVIDYILMNTVWISCNLIMFVVLALSRGILIKQGNNGL